MSRPRARVSPGNLNRRLHLQEKVLVQDPVFGLTDECWQTQATVWGRVEALRGAELQAAASVFEALTVLITIRHRTDIKPGWRIVQGDTIPVECGGNPTGQDNPALGAVVWKIEAMEQQDERDRYLNITAKLDPLA